MRRGTNTPANPLAMPEYMFPAFKDTTGRIRIDPRPFQTDSTLVSVCVGQSNIANTVTGGEYTPAHITSVANLNPFDGAIYLGKDPALGCTQNTGSWLFRFADKIVNHGRFDRVVIVPVGVGSTSVTDWSTGVLKNHPLAAARRCAALGLAPTCFLWQQGESSHAMSKAAYKSNLQQVIDSLRNAGFDAPWFIGVSTYLFGTPSATIQQAQQEMPNGTDIFAGADTDTLTGLTYREANLNHFNPTGANAASALWRDAVLAEL